jgi:hypothetical protein
VEEWRTPAHEKAPSAVSLSGEATAPVESLEGHGNGEHTGGTKGDKDIGGDGGKGLGSPSAKEEQSDPAASEKEEDESSTEGDNTSAVAPHETGEEATGSYLRNLCQLAPTPSKQTTLDGKTVEGEERWQCPFCPNISYKVRKDGTGPLSRHFNEKHADVLKTVLEDEHGRKRSRSESCRIAAMLREKAIRDKVKGSSYTHIPVIAKFLTCSSGCRSAITAQSDGQPKNLGRRTAASGQAASHAPYTCERHQLRVHSCRGPPSS